MDVSVWRKQISSRGRPNSNSGQDSISIQEHQTADFEA